MTPDEAAKLADDIVAAWPAGPKRYQWFAVLGDVADHPAARTAFTKLRASDDRPPSIARFLEHYRLARIARTPTPAPPPAGPTMSMQAHIDNLRAWALEGDDDARDQLLAMYRHRRPAKDHA